MGYIIAILIWIYFLSVFKRNKLNFFYFLTGSIGMFIFLVKLVLEKLVDPLSTIVALVVGFFDNVYPAIQSYPDYKLIFLEIDVPISLYIDFECSGILEIFAFVSLITFFSAYNVLSKFIVNIFGIFYIISANVIRILSIIFIVDTFGEQAYYVAHTFVGRLIFYFLTVLLYFVVFSKKQILEQKVGNFEYDQ